MTTKKLLTEATDDEVRLYARISHGLEVDGRFGREKILTMLADATGMDVNREDLQIVIHDGNPQTPTVTGGISSYRVYDPAEEKWVDCDSTDEGARLGMKINIPTEDREGGARPVYTNHNGKAFLIPRGKPVWVPMEYVNILQNAIETVYDMDENGKIMGEREVPRFNFSQVA